MEEHQPERERNRPANISAILSLVAFVTFFLYVPFHSRVMHARASGGETDLMTIHILSLIRLLATLLAICAVAISLKAIGQRPRRLGVYALIVALFALFLTTAVLL